MCLGDIYAEKDKRDYTTKDLVLRLSEEMALIAESLRKEAREELVYRVPRLFVWLFAFCSMHSLDLEDTLWSKYRGCCPYCGAKTSCFCIANESKGHLYHAEDDVARPVTVSEWQQFLFRIYGRINKLLPLTTVGLHLAEEVGELSRAFRLQERDGKKPLCDEVADTMAWLFALSSKLHIDLGEVMWEAYPGVCDVCCRPKCECSLV